MEVRVDDEGYNTQVVRIHDDDSESEEVLVSKDVKTYKLKYKGTSIEAVREGVEIANGIADLIGKIIEWFKPFSINWSIHLETLIFHTFIKMKYTNWTIDIKVKIIDQQ